MAEKIIQTENLSKMFTDFWRRPSAKAVDALTFSVERGQVYGLLGPNGSGKSTTIKLILGLLFPSAGQVAVFGKPPSDVSIKKRIGYLPEETYLYKYLDADETLDFYGRLFELPAEEREYRTESLLRLTGLTSARNRPLGEYSKGMARRIGIAQALINDPELVILDEPTTGLDPVGTRQVKNLILNLKEKGKTVLLCSHLLSDVEDICDKLLIMYGGRVYTEGNTLDLLSQDNKVQITAPMSDETVDEVLDLIEEREGEDVDLSVGPPVERLETFFLRMVEEAEKLNVYTSGVGKADMSAYFGDREDTDKNVIESLVNAEPAKNSDGEKNATSESNTNKESSSVLNNLTSPKSSASEAGNALSDKYVEKSENSKTEKPEATKAILDKLVNKDDGDKNK